MWRTLIITQGQKISIRDNWLIVENEEDENKVPISDIYSVIMDNRYTSLTVSSITALTNAGVHILFCDEKHNPVSVITALNTHYRPFSVIKKQIEMKDEFKDLLWQSIIKAKIQNQAQVLKMCHSPEKNIMALLAFRDEVMKGDKTNREGLSAKMFFRTIYGSEFIRMKDDCTNAALNYGYAIIRSSVAKMLSAYGYNCVIGIHHISEMNAFNLADDIMEPLRPIVDLWVDKHCDELTNELTQRHRKSLIDIMNTTVSLEGRNMKVRYAIDRYVSSLTSAIEGKDVGKLKLPNITHHTLEWGEFGDD